LATMPVFEGIGPAETVKVKLKSMRNESIFLITAPFCERYKYHVSPGYLR
jgi:hypothetical protein